jgi:hypothetical protein
MGRKAHPGGHGGNGLPAAPAESTDDRTDGRTYSRS